LVVGAALVGVGSGVVVLARHGWWLSRVGWLLVVGWWWVEICIVDASIFWCSVVRLLVCEVCVCG